MAKPTGLRITRIHNQKSGSKDLEDEYVVIVNEGTETWGLSGWLVTDETDQQLRPHVYTFPEKLTSGSGWTFDPGEAIFVITGPGADTFIANPAGAGNRPQFHFHWNRTSFVWNNSGDRVYLRHPDGRFATEPFPVP
jgi:Lamin Tail Domain